MSINKCVLVGRLTKDPDVRTTQSGTKVGNFTIAVNRNYKQEGKPTADFIPIVVWSKTADFVGNYFKKGMKVIVSGRIENEIWVDDSENKHQVTKIIADEVDFADAKRESNDIKNDDFSTEDSEDELPFN